MTKKTAVDGRISDTAMFVKEPQTIFAKVEHKTSKIDILLYKFVKIFESMKKYDKRIT